MGREGGPWRGVTGAALRGLRERKHLVLLLVLALGLLLQPLAHGLLLGLVVNDLLLTLGLLAVFLVVFERRREWLVALGVGLPTLLSDWAGHALAGGPRLACWAAHHGLVALFLGFAVVVVLRNLFRARSIRADQVLGTCCGYLLAGVAWGNLYLLAQLLRPGSFRVGPEVAWQLGDEQARRFLFNYFSFTTLATLGYGDVTPVGPAAATLSWLEAVFGQFYLAAVVAQLVGLKLAQAVRPPGPGPE